MEISAVRIRRRKPRFKKAGVVAAALVTALAAAIIAAVDSVVREPLIGYAEERVCDEAASVLNAAVRDSVASRGMPQMNKQTEGETVIITVDTSAMGTLVADIASRAQEGLASLGKNGVSVQLGSAIGPAALSGRGPSIRAGFTPVGSIVTKVSSDLRSSGINQSLFTISLTMIASVRVTVAGEETVVSVKNTVPLCETVIVGKVPQVYTNVANEEDMLNLIPTDIP
ncbi:MAG: sporulation protein YunB [Clostridia bacterium]|nr:sporulation protein YunB [Clostridia bacterium]